MKAFLLLFILVLPLTSSIQITEVELNPLGSDAGNEWIEFYSEEEIDLEGYKIINNDGGEIILNGSFEGYFVHEFSKQWLDNSDEKISLYNGNDLIQSTPILEDNFDSSLTFSYCKTWEFVESTKDEKNNCKEDLKEETIEQTKEEPKTINLPKESKPIIQETIELNPKTIKTNENSKESKNKYSKYSIVLFCILLLFLLIKKPKKKNEFR